jgi:hypothetical protein
VSAKLEDGNVRAALRIISSDDKPADNNEAVYRQLVERHPSAAPDRAPVSDHLPGNIINLQVTEKEVMHAIRSFPSGSAGGPDGLRPQHVLDMVKCADTGPALLTSITELVNALLRGQCARDVIPILFGASLTALEKKTGGIRPIAVGYFWRRLENEREFLLTGSLNELIYCMVYSVVPVRLWLASSLIFPKLLILLITKSY